MSDGAPKSGNDGHFISVLLTLVLTGSPLLGASVVLFAAAVTLVALGAIPLWAFVGIGGGAVLVVCLVTVLAVRRSRAAEGSAPEARRDRSGSGPSGSTIDPWTPFFH
jgi:cell division protein FtsW (lipid II flippase)